MLLRRAACALPATTINASTVVSARRGFLQRLELVNKGTAFTRAERDALGLRGLLPPAVETLERQAIRALLQFNNLPGDIEKFNFLSRLKHLSPQLFYHLLLNNMEQMTPIVYTYFHFHFHCLALKACSHSSFA